MRKCELSKSLEYAVQKTVNKIEETVDRKSWEIYQESELFHEVISSILGSQVQFETASYYSDQLHRRELTNVDWNNSNLNDFEEKVYQVLSTPPDDKRKIGKKAIGYRYPKIRANQIRRTAELIYGKGHTFKGLLSQSNDARAARTEIMERTVGLGPKQASLFLRNIGFSDDVAILDTHVLRFMFILRLTSENIRSVPRISDYEIIEHKLVNYASQTNHKLSSLDMAIWIVMRVYTKEFEQWD